MSIAFPLSLPATLTIPAASSNEIGGRINKQGKRASTLDAPSSTHSGRLFLAVSLCSTISSSRPWFPNWSKLRFGLGHLAAARQLVPTTPVVTTYVLSL